MCTLDRSGRAQAGKIAGWENRRLGKAQAGKSAGWEKRRLEKRRLGKALPCLLVARTKTSLYTAWQALDS